MVKTRIDCGDPIMKLSHDYMYEAKTMSVLGITENEEMIVIAYKMPRKYGGFNLLRVGYLSTGKQRKEAETLVINQDVNAVYTGEYGFGEEDTRMITILDDIDTIIQKGRLAHELVC